MAEARSFGLAAEARTGLTLDDLASDAARGTVVIVALQAWPTHSVADWRSNWEDGHYVVVVGLTDDRVYVMDPSVRTVATVTWRCTANSWRAGATTTSRTVNRSSTTDLVSRFAGKPGCHVTPTRRRRFSSHCAAGCVLRVGSVGGRSRDRFASEKLG